MKPPSGRGGGQKSDPTIELNDSSLLSISATKARPGGKKNPDVSLWRGEVVASEDFVPARKQRRVRPWFVVALLAAIGAAAAIYVMTQRDDEGGTVPAATPRLPAATTPPLDAPAPPVAPDAAPPPDAAAPVDAAAATDAAPAPDAAPPPPAVTKKVTPKKKVTTKKRAIKKKAKKKKHR